MVYDAVCTLLMAVVAGPTHGKRAGTIPRSVGSVSITDCFFMCESSEKPLCMTEIDCSHSVSCDLLVIGRRQYSVGACKSVHAKSIAFGNCYENAQRP